MSRPTKKIKKESTNLSFSPENKAKIEAYVASKSESMSAMAERLLLAEIARCHGAEDLNLSVSEEVGSVIVAARKRAKKIA